MSPKKGSLQVAGAKKVSKKITKSLATSAMKALQTSKGSAGSKIASKASAKKVVLKKPAHLQATLGKEAGNVQETLSEAGSLNEKLDLLKNADLSANEKLKLMHMNMTHPEWVKLHGRFATVAEKDKDLKTSHETAVTRSEKRNLIAAFFLDPTKGPVFQHLSHKITTSQSLTKVEKWESTKEVLKKWTEDELESMLASGRYISREDPLSPGVWEYQDTQKIEGSKKLDRTKVFARKHDGDLQPENKAADDEAMGKMWSAAGSKGTFNDRSFWGGGEETEASGKGVKGKGSLPIRGGGAVPRNPPGSYCFNYMFCCFEHCCYLFAFI